MREIKFRAWDKLFREMFDVAMVSREAVFHTTPQLKSVMPNGVPLNQVKLMQYTGLKDKNGKEIYEGDIVKVTDALTSRYEITWRNGAWHGKLNTTSTPLYFSLFDCVSGTQCEVIGNIYELV